MKRTKTFFAVLLTLLTILLLSFAVACGAPDEVTPGGDDNPGTVTPNPDDDNPDDPDDPVNPDTPVTPTEKTFTVTVNEGENGSVTLSPEADGNKYKENTTLTVTVTPDEGYVIDSFTVSTDEDAALDNGTYTLTVTADTTVSAAFKLHAHVQDTEKGLQHDATSHWYVCKVCGEKMESTVANHSLKINDAKDKFECDQCGYSESHTHDLETRSAGEEGHKEVCKTDGCGYEGEVASHSLKINAEKTAFVCEQCEYEESHTHDTELQNAGAEGHKTVCKTDGCGYESAVTAHTAKDDEWQHDEGDKTTGKHWQLCECGEKVNEEAHEMEAVSDGETVGHHYECECGYKTTTSEPHKFTTWQYLDPKTGKHDSFCDDCDQKTSEFHDMYVEATEEGETIKCSENCGYTWTRAHKMDKIVDDGEGGCHVECANNEASPKCDYKTETKPHTITAWHVQDDPSKGHTGTCSQCSHVVTEAHDQDGEGGACSKCGYVDAGEHTCADNADENGFRDGLCDLCKQQLATPVWSVASNGGLSLTSTAKSSADYKKIKVPVSGEALTYTGVTFTSNNNITDLIIPEGAALGAAACIMCTKLESLVILGSLPTMQGNLLAKCSSLTTLVLPASLTEFASSAFGADALFAGNSALTVYSLNAEFTLKDSADVGSTSYAKSREYIKQVKVLLYNAEGEEGGEGWHWEVECVTPKAWNASALSAASIALPVSRKEY